MEIESIEEPGNKPIDTLALHELCRKQAGKPVTLHVLRQGSPRVARLEVPAISSVWKNKIPD